jgi:large subunit ribosomal protein L23
MSTAPTKQATPAKTAPSAVKAAGADKTTAAGKAKSAAPKVLRTTNPKPPVKGAPKAPKPVVVKRPLHSEGRLAQVLMAPIVSEKATLISEKRNQVTFQVLRDATKPEIKAAVELMFKVQVSSVQTVVQKGKVKKFGRSIGRRDHVKKAYVSLAAGQELNFSGEGA